MRWLLFLAKVTFILNIFFIICLLMRHTNFYVPIAFTELIIIQGWILSVVFNVIFGTAATIVRSRYGETGVPSWILFSNFACMFLQVVYYLFSY